LLLASSGVAPDRHLAQARSRYCTQGASGNGEPPGAADANASTPHAGAAPRRVLVVDDEALVRRMLSLFLTRAGFAPVAVESGSAALDLLRAGEAFELLITDQSMPGMTGCELIGEVVQLRPGLPVLLVTGYDMIGGLEQLPADVPVLRKPAERAAFLSQVRTLLSTTQAEESNQSET
jgi:CheY-like chemotaxis protein